MAEYIEREDVEKMINNLANEPHYYHSGETFFDGLATVNIDLYDIPIADVVEVVRCKDCKHRYVPCRCALWYGTNNGNEYFIERGDDFSCSYGKRKEGAEE